MIGERKGDAMNEMEAGAESRGREALIWDLKQKLETMTEERDTLRAIIDHIHYCPSPDHVSPAAVECTKYDRAMELLAHSMAARASLDLQNGVMRKALEDIAKREGAGLDGSTENATGRKARLALEGKYETPCPTCGYSYWMGSCCTHCGFVENRVEEKPKCEGKHEAGMKDGKWWCHACDSPIRFGEGNHKETALICKWCGVELSKILGWLHSKDCTEKRKEPLASEGQPIPWKVHWDHASVFLSSHVILEGEEFNRGWRAAVDKIQEAVDERDREPNS